MGFQGGLTSKADFKGNRLTSKATSGGRLPKATVGRRPKRQPTNVYAYRLVNVFFTLFVKNASSIMSSWTL